MASIGLGVPAWFIAVYDDQMRAISLADLPGTIDQNHNLAGAAILVGYSRAQTAWIRSRALAKLAMAI